MDTMFVDCWSIIGKQHFSQGEVSQDYALANALYPSTALAVVSDGCSGANANTDIGSRVLSWSFYEWFISNRGNVQNISTLLDVFKEKMFTNNINDYLATLVALWANDGKANVIFFGDGEVVIKYRSGDFEFIQIEFENNMPFYLAYLLMDNFEQFFCKFKAEIKTSCFSVNGCVEEKVVPVSNKDLIDGIHLSFDTDNIESIFITTDGLSQTFGIDKNSFIAEMFNFKTLNGSFLKRRMLNLCKKFNKENKGWIDDFSIAGFIFGEEDGTTRKD